MGKQTISNAKLMFLQAIIVALITAIPSYIIAYKSGTLEGVDKGLQKAVSGQTWKFMDDNGTWVGTWVIPEFGQQFECTQTHISNGQHLTALCYTIRSGNVYAVQKTNVSDGNLCNYFGIETGGVIKGKYYCVSGGHHNWSAQILSN